MQRKAWLNEAPAPAKHCSGPAWTARVGAGGSPGVGVTSKSGFGISLVFACVLALLAGPAWALGLGRIEVKSQPGQPLLAEIPIISNDPAELEHLQARLASPETFRRVGLQPPDMEVTGLQFAVALDRRGNPVIRVTSQAPLRQPLLTFLLEVDWGQGRLVREYSALLDAPNTVAATAQPIQAPVLAPSNTIVRAPVAPPPAAPQPVAPQSAPAAPAPPAPRPAVAATPPQPMTPQARQVPASAPPSPATPPPGRRVVRSGDTLSEIAVGMDGSYSLDQTMLALLHANPDAFIGGNINRLKQGAVLRRPDADDLRRYNRGEAAAMVRTQVAQWQQASAPQPQPAAVADTTVAARDSAAPASTDARLEIAPTSSGGRQAGTRSGIQAGGEGEMLQQQLQEARETLAARDAEVGELKSRVAELEKLQQQQQQLIAMKDSALATAQQNLARTNAGAPATQAAVQPPPSSRDAGAGLWLWGGVALLVLALLGWLLSRRRRPAAATRGFDTAAMAASIPGTTAPAADAWSDGDTNEDDAIVGEFESNDSSFALAEDDVGDAEAVEADANADIDRDTTATAGDTSPTAPHWTAAPALVGTVPTWHGAEAAAVAAIPDTRSAGEQLELARAYLDLGDDDSARALLREVLDGRDPAARETAARMLRDL